MTKYILESTVVEPLSKDRPKQIVILCHGYGGDGKDISSLAIQWRRFLLESSGKLNSRTQLSKLITSGFRPQIVVLWHIKFNNIQGL